MDIHSPELLRYAKTQKHVFDHFACQPHTRDISKNFVVVVGVVVVPPRTVYIYIDSIYIYRDVWGEQYLAFLSGFC